MSETLNVGLVIKAYIISGLIAALLGLFSFFTGFYDLFMYDAFRIMGTFKDPNVFGSFYVPIIIILLEELRKPQNLDFNPVIYQMLTAIFGMAVVLSFSRAAWLSLTISVVLFLVLNIKKLNMRIISKYIFAGSLFVIITTLSLISTSNVDNFLNRIRFQPYDEDRFTTQARSLGLDIEVEYAGSNKLKIVNEDRTVEKNHSTDKSALGDSQNVKSKENAQNSEGLQENEAKVGKTIDGDNVAENQNNNNIKLGYLVNKLFGIGPGQFEPTFNYAAHSFPVRTYVENGLLGFIFLFLYVGRLLFNRAKNIFVKHIDNGLIPDKVIVAILIGVLVNGLFIDIVHWRHFWVLLSIAYTVEKT